MNFSDQTDFPDLLDVSVPGLGEFRQQLKSQHFLERQPQAPIYHYTSAEGLVGIIENKNLWCTDIEYMNDSEELSYAEELVINVIDDIRSSNKEHDKFFDQIQIDTSLPFGKLFNVYVACFCEKKDLLSQWDNYGKYSIEFDTSSPFRTDIHYVYPSEWPKARLRKVEYSKDRQVEIITYIVKGLFSLFLNQLKQTKKDYEVVAGFYGINFVTMVMEYIISFKHSHFNDEHEWRLIHIGSKEKSKRNIKFRTNGDKIIPYIESGIRKLQESKYKGQYREEWKNYKQSSEREKDISFDNFLREEGNFPVKSVRIGPVSNQNMIRKSIKDLLQKNALSEAEVLISEC